MIAPVTRADGEAIRCDGCGRREVITPGEHRGQGSKSIDDLTDLGWVLGTERTVGDGSNIHLCPACAG